MKFVLTQSIEKQTFTTISPRMVEPRKHSAPAFSRAYHFCLALVPMVIAQGYVQFKDYWDRGAFPEWLGYTGFAKGMVLIDYNGWNHLLVVGLFVFGMGSAIAVLYGIDRLEKFETEHSPE